MAVVIYFSDSISKKKDQMRSFRYGILPYAIWLVVLGGLVGLEPHLSGAILIMGVGAALMLVGGINWAWVIGAVCHRLQYLSDHLLAEPVGGCPGSGLAAIPEPDYHRLRRAVGCRLGQKPTKIPLPARGTQ